MSSTAADVATRLGDAIAGVDRTTQFYKGAKLAGDIDQTRAQTEASMALARQRRLAAEQAELTKRAVESAQAALNNPNADPMNAPLGDIVAGKLGSDYSGAMQGRNYGQQHNQRNTVATPEGAQLGDTIVTEDMRRAAEDALAPGAAIATRRPRAPGSPVIVDDGAGGSVYVSPEDAPGRTPAARPAPARAPQGPTTQSRQIDELIARGMDKDTATRLVYRRYPNAQAAFDSVYRAQLGQFATEAQAAEAARAAVEASYGAGALDEQLYPPDAGDEEFGEGEEVENPDTGQVLVLRGGVWVDKDTGQPVQ